MKKINFTKEILKVLAILLPVFGKFQDDDSDHCADWVTYVALITPTYDGRYFLSFFCEGDPVRMCPVGVVDTFLVWDEERKKFVKAIHGQYHMCLAMLYKNRVNIDVFASVSMKQSRLFGPLGIQEVGESLYQQNLKASGFGFKEYCGKMALSNTLVISNGEPPFGN